MGFLLVCANFSRKTKDQHRTKPYRARTDYDRTRSGVKRTERGNII